MDSPQPENIMKALRNFEALFIAIIGLACAANFVYENRTVESKAPASYASAAQAAPAVPVVVVAAKRMSEAEKQASLAEERKAAKGSNI
jgi:hypothetical protein